MKSCLKALSVCVLFVFYARTNGQCQNVGSYPTITSYEENKSGESVFLDFYKINRSCACVVKSFYTGELLVQVSLATRLYSCTEDVFVSLEDKTVLFKCDAEYPSSDVFRVEANYTAVKITADYRAGFSLDKFYPCLLFRENGGRGEILKVSCGSQTNMLSTSETTTRVISTKTFAHFSSSLETTKMATKQVFLTDISTINGIQTEISTGRSENLICSSASDANLLSLQVPLTLFIVISIVLAMSIVYVRMKSRFNSLNEKNNGSVETSIQRTRSGTNTDNYTELDLVNIAVEPENQYDSLCSSRKLYKHELGVMSVD